MIRPSATKRGTIMAICTCCEEREISAEAAKHGFELCDECATTTVCENCGYDTCYAHAEWETDRELCWCDKCREKYQRATEMDDLEQEVERLAAEHQWDVVDRRLADTGSVYIELHRECDVCILGKDDDCTCESLSVRISDHGSAYCSEDVSLVIPSGNAGGDDHTVEILRKRLIRKPPIGAN